MNRKRVRAVVAVGGSSRAAETRKGFWEAGSGDGVECGLESAGVCIPNDVWSYDFMSDVTRDGRPLRILNVVDEYTRVCVGCTVARSIGAGDVAADA